MMEDIKLTGVQIIDHQRLKQTGRLRLVIELTEKDALQYCGSFAVAEQHQHISNVTFKFTEAQGENNGYEESLKKAAKPKEVQRDLTVFQELRNKCIEYTSEKYYEAMKKYLKIEHLKDLAKLYTINEAYELCILQIRYVDHIMHGIGHFGAIDLIKRTTSKKDYDLWFDTFELFNAQKCK